MPPKEECEEFLSFLFPFAEEQLKKHGEFYPFGAVISENGKIETTAGFDGDDFPKSEEIIKRLISEHKSLAAEKKIRASGIVWNGSICDNNGKKTDAVIASLEHKDNYSVVIAEPYKTGIFKNIRFEGLSAMHGNHDVF